ncbi:MAG: hypothetical protein OSA83_14440 [Pseudomonadales bacterium]|nr:hypothetical protein [Pseudomonadales bacterium]
MKIHLLLVCVLLFLPLKSLSTQESAAKACECGEKNDQTDKNRPGDLTFGARQFARYSIEGTKIGVAAEYDVLCKRCLYD